MVKFDSTRFKWHEIFSNSDGKSSGSAFLGIILGMVTAVSFLACMIGWFLDKTSVIDVMEEVILLAGISSTLLGVRKIFGARKDGTTIVNTEAGDQQQNKKEEIINQEKG